SCVQATIENIKAIGPQLMKTTTFDHGLSWAEHDLVMESCGLDTFFSWPDSTREKERLKTESTETNYQIK
ncbi:MAG: hypothetical protein OXE77_00170, partial [Flavobacteriaceae bacterium]|nr:hypothetical protein [Flavobacteriaceae bacterium]